MHSILQDETVVIRSHRIYTCKKVAQLGELPCSSVYPFIGTNVYFEFGDRIR